MIDIEAFEEAAFERGRDYALRAVVYWVEQVARNPDRVTVVAELEDWIRHPERIPNV